MIGKDVIREKIGDLLILEGRAFEMYKASLRLPESAKYRDALTKMMNDELRHMELVKGILEILG
ncbi:MAG: hypothetical protein QXL35_01970 [Candidatus Bathyarchaeia archaeon]